MAVFGMSELPKPLHPEYTKNNKLVFEVGRSGAMSRQERDPAGLQGVRLGDYARVFTKEYVQKVSHGRVSTGFPGVDRSLNGGFSSGLYVLGAVPGLGKSTLALQIAHNVSKQGVPALYFALEMDRDWITAKSISRYE